MRTLRPKRLARQDQILAVLRDFDRPAKTVDLVALLPYRIDEIRLELNQLAKQGLVEKIEIDGHRVHYWRRLQ